MSEFWETHPKLDRLHDLNYRVGYATELIRQIVAHHTRGDEAALSHSVEVARRFLANGPDQ